MMKLKIIAPGRICLFGDHQDYLELPVIACAIDRQLELTAKENGSNLFRIYMPDIHSERIIPISEKFEILEKGDHYASALRVLRRYGCIPTTGFDLTLKSTVPINAGISSSSAIVVAWIYFLLKAFSSSEKISPEFVAKLAYEAEVLEHHSPGGKMDQFTISLGDIVYIDTSSEFSVTRIGTQMEGLILAESGIPKETFGLLDHVRTKASKAIELVCKKYPNFILHQAEEKDISKLSEELPQHLLPYFSAAILNHEITEKALIEFKKDTLDLHVIGRLMTAHHEILKNDLQITVPQIDCLIDAAMNAGAFGAKIVGSGGGGSIVAISSSEKKEDIIRAIKEAGAKDAYSVSVAKGVHYA